MSIGIPTREIQMFTWGVMLGLCREKEKKAETIGIISGLYTDYIGYMPPVGR